MMRVSRFVVLFTLLLCIPLFPATAQEAGCEIDLSGVVAELLRAQAQAAGGDTEAGLEQLAGIRAALAEITSVCAEAGIEAGVLLDSRFVAPNAAFTFDYPDGWVEGMFTPNPDAGAIFLGNTPTAAQALNSSIPQLGAGEQALAVAVGSANTFGVVEENPTVEAVLQRFAERTLADFQTTGDLEMASLGDRPIGRTEFSGEAFESVLVGIQLEDRPLYAIVVGVAAPGELDSIRRLADAVALSVR